MSLADVESFAGKPLYEPTTLRTLFLEFEDAEWESEMADFYRTDVEVPATLRPGLRNRCRPRVPSAMARQGSALDLTYRVRLRQAVSPSTLVAELKQLGGVESVELRRED